MVEGINFTEYFREIIATGILITILLILRIITKKIIVGFGRKSGLSMPRIKMVLKYKDLLLSILGFVMLIAVWGVEGKQAFLVISSVFTVIGVAMFAQWSMLSNITAGIINFFYFPFRIGDKILIIDKDTPIEAEIIDMKSFYTLMINENGEKISFPNNLLLQKGIVIIKKN